MGEYIIGIGTDLCEVARIQERIENGIFVLRYFTDREIIDCENVGNLLRAERYAARWAGKEAVIKALGGLGEKIPFLDIYILNGQSGKPFVYLEGRAKTRADELNVNKIFLSLSHEKGMASAFCIATAKVKRHFLCFKF